jgi:hypothetical protein
MKLGVSIGNIPQKFILIRTYYSINCTLEIGLNIRMWNDCGMLPK